ncbi:divergent polysaccharide deacetylase family protein [Shimia sp. R9_2]|uniref:divergent polysaccharide deacetylase family protein n=1 Tax=Shimia sp. R9_2 TaxID=2821112 RepID=UPI001ADB6494|nr:divergent polysaccharide deacetylase family protein [Shimia sp. R9_2]MBO9396904.1 divergent polysaccharide deacetylase family protein [Shimia sp. R9_2]
MLRGFLAGVFWGVILIGGVLAAASLLSPLPATVRPQTTAVTPQETQEGLAQSSTLDAASQTDAEVDAVPGAAVPEVEADDAVPLGITDSAPKPEPEDLEAELAAPQEIADSGAVEIEGETSVLPTPQAQTPTAPEAETALSISTNPAQPAAPAPLSGEAFVTPLAPEVTEEAETAEAVETEAPVQEIVIEDPAVEEEAVAQAAPEEAVEETGADVVADAAPVEEVVIEEPALEAAPEGEAAEGETDVIIAEDAPEGADNAEETPLVSEAVPSPEAEDLTPNAEAGETPVDEAATASLLKPAGNLNEAFPQLKSARLPSVGDAATEEVVIADAAAVTPVARPVVSNAEGFENAENKPVMSVVLVDTGEHEFDMEALESFPYPLSIAVSTLDPQVTEKAADYRLRGFEVLAMVDMPAEATASDVEQAMQAHLSVSDTFVGVMEGLSDGLQGSKVVSDQVAQALLGSGHGLLMLSNGLNTAQKLAAKEGVPSTSVFRDFDDAGQTAVVMRRFLDNAAFKAAQEDGVVMVGRLRDETISALLLWALQDRAGTVAMAPISASFDTIN